MEDTLMGEIINIDWDIPTVPSEISLVADYRSGQTPSATEINSFFNSLILQGNLNSDWLLELTVKIPGVVEAIDAVLVAYNEHSDELDATMTALTNLVMSFTADSSEFDTWFQAMKGQLSTDAAGNLQAQVDELVVADGNLKTQIDSIESRISNCILEMPTKPTYSGLNMTIYAGTKILIPNGLNADGTLKSLEYTFPSNLVTAMAGNTTRYIHISTAGVVSSNPSTYVSDVNDITDLPTAVPSTGYYMSFVKNANRTYVTYSGTTTASWYPSTVFRLGSYTATTSAITNLTINEVFRFADYNTVLELSEERLTANKTVYVATTGSDTAGNGSIGQPYKTVTKARSKIPKNLNGYIGYIIIAGGTYSEFINIDGYFGGKLQLALNDGESVILNGNIFIEKSSYVSIELAGTATLTINASTNECIRIRNFSSLQVINVNLILNPTAHYGVGVYGSSRFFSNVTVTINNASRALQIYDMSTASVRILSGTGNTYGIVAGGGSNVSYTTKTIEATTAEAMMDGSFIGNMLNATLQGASITVPITGWTSSITYAGFYEKTFTVDGMVEGALMYGLIPLAAALPTAGEVTAFGLLKHIIGDTTAKTLKFLSTTTPVTQYKINIKGVC